ncbi:hypothetical protein D9758_001311 [Tetrapyrgos nigripes]|uniref:Uncharacterized protein n=1 Tax=Tetrapyrgos nigripes TaxID=182062 RepID=A0A8H5GRB8_9AGAR|nr:hypothetical protein D9758_001311 [Tetrapyrgos nigripes]
MDDIVDLYTDDAPLNRKSSIGGGDRRRITVVEQNSPTTSPVRTTIALVAPPDVPSDSYKDKQDPNPRHLSLVGPHFLQPQSRSPSTNTPVIGAEKDVHDKVAGPVVDYLSYEPGFHSTAGPLPAPPRASAPPRSPMRDIDAVKQSLQLPPDVEAVLASLPESRSSHRREAAFTPSTTQSTIIGASTSSGGPISGLPSSSDPSNLFSMKEQSEYEEPQSPASEYSPSPSPEPMPTRVQPPSPSPPVSQPPSRPSSQPPSRSPSIAHSQYSSQSHSVTPSPAPSPPPKSIRTSFNLNLSKSLRRMSSPHSANAISKSASKSGSSSKSPSPSGSRNSSLELPLKRSLSASGKGRTPSPHVPTLTIPNSMSQTHALYANHPLPPHPYSNISNYPPRPRRPPPHSRMKIAISFTSKTLSSASALNGQALNSMDVPKLKNANERCVAYARKINELWVYDSGLGGWLGGMGVGGVHGYGNSGGGGKSVQGSTDSRTILSPIPASPSHNPDHPSSYPSFPLDSDPSGHNHVSNTSYPPSSFPSDFMASHPSYHPRQVSTSSTDSAASDVTFPRRADASLATDLTAKDKDKENLFIDSPPVPYPTVPNLTNVKANASRGKGVSGLFTISSGHSSGGSDVGGLTPPSSVASRNINLPSTTPTKPGFFASLGRKASTSRHGGGELKSPKLMKKNLSNGSGSGHGHGENGITISAPINVTPLPPVAPLTAPSVPGGPRAIPGRAPGAIASTSSESGKVKGIGISLGIGRGATTDTDTKNTKKSNPRRVSRSQTMMVSGSGSGWQSDSATGSSAGLKSLGFGGSGASSSAAKSSNSGAGSGGRGVTGGPRGPHQHQQHQKPSLYDIPSSEVLDEEDLDHLDLTVKSDSGHTYSYTQTRGPRAPNHPSSSTSTSNSSSQANLDANASSRSRSSVSVPTTATSHPQLHSQKSAGAVSTPVSSRSDSSHSTYSTYSAYSPTAYSPSTSALPLFLHQALLHRRALLLSLILVLTLTLVHLIPHYHPQGPLPALVLATLNLTSPCPNHTHTTNLNPNSMHILRPATAYSNSYSSSSSKPANLPLTHTPHSNKPRPNSNPESSWHPEFARQVDKLHDLLPQAEREVLAGYLRRAGQDVLAIGQYLEDEKCGRIRRD